MATVGGHALPVTTGLGEISELTGLSSDTPERANAPVAGDALRPAVSPAADRVLTQATQNCVLVLADIERSARLWGWSRIVRGSGALRGVPGLRFGKVLGSGHEGGFGLKPSASRQGLFLVFNSAGEARRFIDGSSLLHAYRARAREFLTLRLAAYSVRGSWSGTRIEPSATAPTAGPIAALTRASIRPRAAARFWRHAPPSQAGLESARGCLLAVGLGEAPLLRQATFSLWESATSMDAYARTGPHLAAIRASTSEGYFSESMFVRFVPLEIRGTWKGRVYTDDLLRPAA
jgi:spheroidene monooxygenase